MKHLVLFTLFFAFAVTRLAHSIALSSKGKGVKINPTPGINYSIKL
jgi:hypothetical protein